MNHVSEEIARKLREAGWPQRGEHCGEHDYAGCPKCHDHPNIGELLEMLPIKSEVYKKNDGSYGASSVGFGPEYEKWDLAQESNNPADALALLWMALKEKNLI